jgi:hypothetical protein
MPSPDSLRGQDRFQAPVVESQVQPQYPANLKSFLIESARVEMVIDQQGVPFSVKSATSLPDNVVQALAKWRFRPARRNGAPVGYRVGIPVSIHRRIREQFRNLDALQIRLLQLLWFASNQPKHEVWAGPLASPDPRVETGTDEYKQIRQFWLKHLADEPKRSDAVKSLVEFSPLLGSGYG